VVKTQLHTNEVGFLGWNEISNLYWTLFVPLTFLHKDKTLLYGNNDPSQHQPYNSSCLQELAPFYYERKPTESLVAPRVHQVATVDFCSMVIYRPYNHNGCKLRLLKKTLPENKW